MPMSYESHSRFGPPLGQLLSKPVSVLMSSWLAPRHLGQSSAIATWPSVNNKMDTSIIFMCNDLVRENYPSRFAKATL